MGKRVYETQTGRSPQRRGIFVTELIIAEEKADST